MVSINIGEEIITKVLNKLNTSGEEAKIICNTADEGQQKNILKEWFTQSVVYMVQEISDYQQQLGVIESIFKAVFVEQPQEAYEEHKSGQDSNEFITRTKNSCILRALASIE